MVPIVYDSNVQLTQIVPPEENGEDKNETTTKKKGTGKRKHGSSDGDAMLEPKPKRSRFISKRSGTPSDNTKNLDLKQCHEHLEVARSLKRALKSAASKAGVNDKPDEKSSDGTRLSSLGHPKTTKELAHQHELRRLGSLLGDQERVVRADEHALVRAAVSKRAKSSKKSKSETVTPSKDDKRDCVGLGSSDSSKKKRLNKSPETASPANETDENRGDEERIIPPDEPTEHKPTGASNGKKKASDCNPLTKKDVVSNSSEPLSVGTVVDVDSRTWPGVNRPGGVARISKVIGVDSGAVKYDVSYVLGGREKNVDAIYVHLQQEDQKALLSPIKTTTPRRKRGAGSSTPETEPESSAGRKRSGRKTRRAAQTTEDATEDEDKPVKHTKDTDNSPRPGKRKPLSEMNPNAATKKAKKSTQSNAANLVRKKGSKTRTPTTEEANSRANVSPAGHDVDMNFETTISLVDALYSKRLMGDGERKSSIHVVGSNLSDYEKHLISQLVANLKSKGVSVKLLKEFHPQKTDLCITPTSPLKANCDSSDDDDDEDNDSSAKTVNVLATFRTLKIMRSMLAGIPIVSPTWLSDCIDQKEILPPTGHYCVRTLPIKSDNCEGKMISLAKKNDGVLTADWAVARYAALLHSLSVSDSDEGDKKPHLLFEDTAVLLCGQWKKSASGPKKCDLQILLREAGAMLLTSPAMALKRLKELQRRGSSESSLVLLCDDSTTDATCGITDALWKQAKQIQDEKRNGGASSLPLLLVVTFTWLFDCISCGAVLDASNYEPSSPRAKSLCL